MNDEKPKLTVVGNNPEAKPSAGKEGKGTKLELVPDAQEPLSEFPDVNIENPSILEVSDVIVWATNNYQERLAFSGIAFELEAKNHLTDSGNFVIGRAEVARAVELLSLQVNKIPETKEELDNIKICYEILKRYIAGTSDEDVKAEASQEFLREEIGEFVSEYEAVLLSSKQSEISNISDYDISTRMNFLLSQNSNIGQLYDRLLAIRSNHTKELLEALAIISVLKKILKMEN